MQVLNEDTTIRAANGRQWLAKRVFALALTFFRQLVELELSEQLAGFQLSDVRWVLTVPAIWSATAKQFMRRAAYEAGIASEHEPAQLVIALEPEAAAVYMRTLRLRDLLASPPPNSLAAESELLLSVEQIRSGGVPLVEPASHLRAQSLDAEQFAALVSRSNSRFSTVSTSGALQATPALYRHHYH